jgi:hypothetical protein
MPSLAIIARATRIAPNSVVHASWSSAITAALSSPSSCCSRVTGYRNRSAVQSDAAPAPASEAAANAIALGVPAYTRRPTVAGSVRCSSSSRAAAASARSYGVSSTATCTRSKPNASSTAGSLWSAPLAARSRTERDAAA